MRKLLLIALLFSSLPGFAVTCLTLVKSSRQCDLSTDIADVYTWNKRGWRMKTPNNYAADGTHPMVLVFNGSTSASFPGGGFETTTGWSTKADAVAAALAPVIIYPDSEFGSRYRIQSISGNGATVTIVTKDRHFLTVGTNISITGTNGNGPSTGAYDQTSIAVASVVDAHTVTVTSALNLGTKTIGFVGNTNKSWANYTPKDIPDFTDDIAFINALLAEQLPILNPDRTKIYCVGWSSGAIFCEHLATERGDIIAAVGTAEGFYATTDQYQIGSATKLDTQTVPSPPRPFSVIAFGGTSDTTVVNCSNGLHNTFYSRNSMGETPIWIATANACRTIPTTLGNNAMCTTASAIVPSSASCNSTHSTTGVAVTITNSTHKMVRASGSWATDGFANTDHVTLFSGFAAPPFSGAQSNNGVVCRISTISTTSSANDTITFSTPCNLVDEVTTTSALFYDNITMAFTLPSSPVSGYGFTLASPNNGARILGLKDTGFLQGDIDITTSVAGSTVTTDRLANAWGATNPAQAYCTPGALDVSTATIQPRPYFPAANNQGSWLATDCNDNTQVQLYALQGGGHTYFAHANQATGSISQSIVAGTNPQVTRAAGSYSTDGFVPNLTVTLAGFSNGANNTTCVIQSVVALTITFTSACTAQVSEGPTASTSTTLYDLVPMNSNLTVGEDETDLFWDFFLAHPKASTSGNKQIIRGVKN